MATHQTVLIIVIDTLTPAVEKTLLQLLENSAAQTAEGILLRDETLQSLLVPKPNAREALRESFYAQLTPRQKDVVRYATQGLSNLEISRCLNIVPGVVAARLTEVYELLKTLETPECEIRSNRQGLIHFFGDYFMHHPSLGDAG